MAKVGITDLRIGEFAWSRLKPVRGNLRLDRMIRAVDVRGRYGSKVIVGHADIR